MRRYKSRSKLTGTELHALIDDAATNQSELSFRDVVSSSATDLIVTQPKAKPGWRSIWDEDLGRSGMFFFAGSGMSTGKSSHVRDQAALIGYGTQLGTSKMSLGGVAGSHSVSAIDQLRVAIGELREDIRSLSEAVRGLSVSAERETKIREVSKEEARDEIVELLSKGSELYPSDIAHDLGLDYFLVREILDDLAKEERIKYPSR
jgi:hypothetical protein